MAVQKKTTEKKPQSKPRKKKESKFLSKAEAEQYVTNDWALWRSRELVKVGHFPDPEPSLVQHRDGRVEKVDEAELAERFEPVGPQKAGW